MNSLTLLTFALLIYSGQGQERKAPQLSLNSSHNNLIDMESESGGEKAASSQILSTTERAEKSTQGTKYPILIPRTIDEIEEGEGLSFIDDYQGTQGTAEEAKISPSELSIRSCGVLKEKCYSEGMEGSGRPEKIDFMREPFYCRCDQGECDEYGDCCVTAAHNLRKNNPWKCQLLQHEMIWTLMISKCLSPDDPNRNFCESPDLIPEKKRTYLHDLPVYNNVTQTLYRNVFCAQCNGVPDQDLYRMELQIMCSSNFTTPTERDAFISRAKYRPGQRLWTDGTVNCELYAPQLDQSRVSLLIPNIRFCRRNAIDFCPHDFERKDPLVHALCSSYTQYVISRYGLVVFKNPHCAQCHGIESKKDLKCLHDKVSISPLDGKISPLAGEVNLGSAGLALVFDFDLGGGEGYVGYDMKCKGNSIWDFLRHNCTDIVCPKGHFLSPSTGTCTLDTGLSEPESDNVTLPINKGKISSSNCYLLLIHEGEYVLLDNDSVLVNRTRRSSPTTPGTPGDKEVVETLLLDRGEWEFWNSTTLSMCARKLALGFSERFSPVLNYLSLTALGMSVFFSALHALIFLILPKTRNLPGKNLFCLTLSLLTSQLVFVTLIQNGDPRLCLGAAMTMHYTFLASFCWMNVMSFDIWRTFAFGAKLKIRCHSSNNTRTFIKYSLYAWLMPGFVVGIASLTEFSGLAEAYGESWPILWRMRPLYGQNGLCWISQGLSLFVFFALPVLLIICANIMFFTLTAKGIMEQSQDVFFRAQTSNGAKDGGRDKFVNGGRSRDDQDRMKLYVKLGLIMGLTWGLGFLSGISGWDWLWYPFVLLNGLQGFFIFFAFDFKVKVWRMLKERLDLDPKFMGGLKSGISRKDTSTNSSHTEIELGVASGSSCF